MPKSQWSQPRRPSLRRRELASRASSPWQPRHAAAIRGQGNQVQQPDETGTTEAAGRTTSAPATSLPSACWRTGRRGMVSDIGARGGSGLLICSRRPLNAVCITATTMRVTGSSGTVSVVRCHEPCRPPIVAIAFWAEFSRRQAPVPYAVAPNRRSWWRQTVSAGVVPNVFPRTMRKPGWISLLVQSPCHQHAPDGQRLAPGGRDN